MPDLLRLNALRRRAADLGTDVAHVIYLDAATNREHNQLRRSEAPRPAHYCTRVQIVSAHHRRSEPLLHSGTTTPKSPNV
jgi:hypothetical protein